MGVRAVVPKLGCVCLQGLCEMTHWECTENTDVLTILAFSNLTVYACLCLWYVLK